MLPVRLRDFIEDPDGWIYAVSTYDNDTAVGCVLRYVPDPCGERINPSGIRYKKFDFEDAYALISAQKPEYANLVQRIPHDDIRTVLKPEQEISRIARTHPPGPKNCSIFSGSQKVLSAVPVLCSASWKTMRLILTWWSTGNTGLLHRHS